MDPYQLLGLAQCVFDNRARNTNVRSLDEVLDAVMSCGGYFRYRHSKMARSVRKLHLGGFSRRIAPFL